MALGIFGKGKAEKAEQNSVGAPRTGVDLVLEGGGMRGVFTSGVLDVLMERGVYGFDTVWGDAVRLTVNSSKRLTSIAEFGVFNEKR